MKFRKDLLQTRLINNSKIVIFKKRTFQNFIFLSVCSTTPRNFTFFLKFGMTNLFMDPVFLLAIFEFPKQPLSGNRTKSNTKLFVSSIMFDFVRKPDKNLGLEYV